MRIDEGIQGLVHVSEFTDAEEMKEKLSVGEKRKFEISSIDQEEHRIALKVKEGVDKKH